MLVRRVWACLYVCDHVAAPCCNAYHGLGICMCVHVLEAVMGAVQCVCDVFRYKKDVFSVAMLLWDWHVD